MENNTIQEELLEFENAADIDVTSEESSIANSMKHMEVLLKHQELEDRKQDMEQRKIYSYYIFYYICVYMGIVLIMLLLNGFGCFSLSDTVLVTLLTTTMANVLGLFVIVTKYLFHTKS